MKGVFVSDCEGPISKNDNAYELTSHFVPNGDKLFALISKYDDVLADVLKRQGYNAGDTLKLILPFLKAYGVTDKKMQEFSARTLLLIAGTRETIRHIASVAEAFIVSTSYEHYILALCKYIGFPFKNTYCTRISLDKYHFTAIEDGLLKAIAHELSQMPLITIPDGAKTLDDFSNQDQQTIRLLDDFFWTQIPAIGGDRIFAEVATVGGEQKAEAIRDIAKKRKLPISEVLYVGDSITDVQAFQLVREGGGLTVSFNGNNYAIKNAEVSVMSDNNLVTGVLANVFHKYGKPRTLKLVENWNAEFLKQSSIDPVLLKRFFALFPKALPKVQIVTQSNMESLSKESSQFRKKVRGEGVGQLG